MSQQSPSSCRTLPVFESTEKEREVRNDGSPQMRIAKITSCGEEHFERYGGDDIHELLGLRPHIRDTTLFRCTYFLFRYMVMGI